MAARAQHRVQLLDHVHRQADGARLVHDRALDALADPPGGIGGEAKPALRIELLDGVDQPEIAFFDQVEQRESAVAVVLGDVDHQPQVVLDHLLARGEIPAARQPRVVQLLLRAEELAVPDLVEVDLGHVRQEVRAGIVLLRGLARREPPRPPPGTLTSRSRVMTRLPLADTATGRPACRGGGSRSAGTRAGSPSRPSPRSSALWPRAPPP